MIRIIDYGLGNIQAFLNVYKRLGIPAERATNPAALEGARHVILPGVGAFDRAMSLFDASGFRAPVERLIAETEVRVLGNCVGMQMLSEGSDEGQLPGLGWVPGHVRHLDVVFVKPGEELRLTGGLGPLQPIGASGTMVVQFKQAETGTTIDLTYAVHGYLPAGMESWAEPVDRVLALQLERLKRLIDTGSPAAAE